MQTVFKQCVMSVILLLAGPTMALTCAKCGGYVLATDSFCQKCGADVVVSSPVVSDPPSQPMQEATSSAPCASGQAWSGPASDLPFYQGMGRGLVTTCAAPMEYLRCTSVLCSHLADNDSINGRGDWGPIGAVLMAGVAVPWVTAGLALGGTISAVGDVGVGTLDFLTFGAVGDAVWKDRRKSPYFWRRKWSSKGDIRGAVFDDF